MKIRQIVESTFNKNGYPDDAVEVTIVCSKDAADESIVPLINHMANIGNVGHSYSIIVDPENSDTKKQFGFDGDGNHKIHDVLLDGKQARDKK